MFYKGGTLFRLLLMCAGRIKYLLCPHAFWKASPGSGTDKQQPTESFLTYTSPCSCRLFTQAQKRVGRSTARRRTQMGSVSVPWSHQPRTCVTATHAAGSSASSWRRWQLSITHSRLWPTQTHKLPHCVCHIQAAEGNSLPLPTQCISHADEQGAKGETVLEQQSS